MIYNDVFTAHSAGVCLTVFVIFWSTGWVIQGDSICMLTSQNKFLASPMLLPSWRAVMLANL